MLGKGIIEKHGEHAAAEDWYKLSTSKLTTV